MYTLEANGSVFDSNFRNGKILLLANVDIGLLKANGGSMDFVFGKKALIESLIFPTL